MKTLPSIIGAFKTTSSKLIHQNNLPEFKWQKSFHDHIIRNDKSLKRIREYIINNPATWQDDNENINKIDNHENTYCLTPICPPMSRDKKLPLNILLEYISMFLNNQ
jgi:hypothetical protein